MPTTLTEFDEDEQIRVNAAVVYCRSYIQTQERIREGVTQEMLDRNPKRFAQLMDPPEQNRPQAAQA